MIRYIKGTFTMQFDSGIVIETGSGIGFEIYVPSGSPIYKHSEGDEIQVFTEMIVREDGMSLYGFHNRESLEFFKLLTSVSGIGPKGAMGILGSMPVNELKYAIASGDVKAIAKAQGVGKKTAERLVVELKDKVGGADFDLENGEITLSQGNESAADDARSEAISALISLGYARAEAFKAVSAVGDEGLTSEEYIKKALRSLF
ncbi:MAG: Holliday junction branch migration protein RuvA [Clostridiales bacterium]|nr:Holliday junction branch migration protein RuvA [Clostridiales bacterium]MBQ5441100.1 Holliday junction branch migration protein RuvA [Bacillota bacterium]